MALIGLRPPIRQNSPDTVAKSDREIVRKNSNYRFRREQTCVRVQTSLSSENKLLLSVRSAQVLSLVEQDTGHQQKCHVNSISQRAARIFSETQDKKIDDHQEWP